MNKLVSVIIPTYNRENFIEKTLKSVLDQTYNDLEIIIVDDGSVDDTRLIVNKYKKMYGEKLRYFYKENGGVSAARNLGIEVAKGEYLSFLDSDDYIDEDKIKLQIESIMYNDADFCYCGYVMVNKHEKVICKSRIDFTKNNILSNYIKGRTTPQTNSWLIKKELFNNIRFREGCSWGEDMEVFVKIISKGKGCFVDKRLFKLYVDDQANRLSSFSWNKIDEDVFIWNQIWLWLESNIDDNEFKDKIKKDIFNYRIPALIIYRLCLGNMRDPEFLSFYYKYKEVIEKMDFSNGLRSLKLRLYYVKLKINLFLRCCNERRS